MRQDPALPAFVSSLTRRIVAKEYPASVNQERRFREIIMTGVASIHVAHGKQIQAFEARYAKGMSPDDP